jgi:hypothetical protein
LLHHAAVLDGAVVPQHQIAGLPRVAVNVCRMLDMRVEPGKQRAAVAIIQALYVRSA